MVNLINITYHDITDMHIHVTMVIYSVRVNQLIISKFRLCCCPHGRCKKPGQGHQDATLWWRWRGSTTTLWTVLTSRERRCSRSDAHTLQKELSHVESLDMCCGSFGQHRQEVVREHASPTIPITIWQAVCTRCTACAWKCFLCLNIHQCLSDIIVAD